MTEEEQAALDLFLAFETQHNTHFSAQWFRLYHKADASNKRRMTPGFVTMATIYEQWALAEKPEDFYNHYNVRQNYRPDAPPKHAPIPGDIKEIMQAIGHTINEMINEEADRPMCFLLMVFDVGEGGVTSYLSNANREDVLTMLDEFLEKSRAGAIIQ